MEGGEVNKTELRKIAHDIKITDYIDYRMWMKAIYLEAKHREKSYSYAKMSSDLGLGSSNAHLVVTGKRDLTAKTGSKVADALKLGSLHRQYFIKLIEYTRAKDAVDRDVFFQELLKIKSKQLPNEIEKQKLQFFSEWYNGAILELLRLDDAKDTPEWISENLSPKVTVPQVKRSLELLKELGYVKFQEDKNRLFPTNKTVSTGNEAAGLAIVRFHQQMLDIAKAAIDGFDYTEREISAVTLSIPHELKPEIKAEIVKLRKKLIEMSNECSNGNEIVQVNFQLFPLARLGRSD